MKHPMLPSLPDFLSHVGMTKADNRFTIMQFIPTWCEILIEDIKALLGNGLLTPSAAEQCSRAIQCWIDNPERNLPEKTSFAFFDELHIKMLHFIQSNMALNPNLIRIPGDYPFEKKLAGVAIRARITETSPSLRFLFSHDVRSTVGANDSEKSALKKEVRTQLGDIDWLSKQLSKIGKTVSDVLPQEPHAETIWFVRHVDGILGYAKANLKDLAPLNDSFPQSQCASKVRMEVITSSSCCMDRCRLLFSALRLELEDHHIHLPMVFYADRAYNSTPRYKEHTGSIYTINSKGQFVNSNLRCHTPSTACQISIPLESNPVTDLSNNEQRQYNLLANIGGMVLLDLLKVGSGNELGPDRINPLTYIAPDTVIIFLADYLAKQPGTPKKAREAMKFLDTTLANMDLSLLTHWRMAFCDHLHWLLISHKDPKYLTQARKSAAAANINFPLIKATGDEESEYEKFYRLFDKLWHNQPELMKLYTEMLRFCDATMMPFGVCVGPVSTRMLLDNSLYTTRMPRERNMLLKYRSISPSNTSNT